MAPQKLKMFFLVDCETPQVLERFEEHDHDH